jgi:hypothetical protein
MVAFLSLVDKPNGNHDASEKLAFSAAIAE